MTAEEIKQRTRQFVSRFFTNVYIEDDTDIFAIGFVSSLFAMQLLMFIEQEFEVKVGDEDMGIENFNTLNAIAALVLRLRGEG